MQPSLEETIYADFVTSSPTTGAAIDADSTPTAEVFEDATDTAILSPTITKRTGKTGNYRVPVACTAANGFEVGKSYNVIVSATVGAVAAKASILTFQVRAVAVAGASQASVDAIAAKTANLPSDPADASDIAAAFSSLNTKVDGVKVKTDNLPTDPADASIIADQFTSLDGKINTVAGYIDTEVAAIKAKTDQMTFSGGKIDANATLAITAGDLTAIADSILKRDWTSVSGEAVYSLLNAARMLRNAWQTTGGVLVVKKEDGSTNAWSRPLAVDPAAQPIVGAS